MDALSDPAIQRIVFKKSSQVGWTEILNNICGYFIDQDPSPVLVLQPTLEMAEAWSNDRLAPMIRDTPCLADKIANNRARDSGNKTLQKRFRGGHLTIAGANSPASLASRPIRVVLADEVDRYPESAGKEGDPLSLAFVRTKNFWNRKLLAGGTPTIAGHSRTDAEFNRSDQRYFHVPCPACGTMQTLRWAQVKWEKDAAGRDLPETAYYLCADEACGAWWSDAERWKAVSKGEWRATAPFTGIAGFHIWEAYSPWVTLASTVGDFIEKRGNPETLKTWTNTALGECWQERGEAPDWQRLYERRSKELMLGEVPEWAGVLTIGSDIQRDRIEADVWAWGPGMQSALVDHLVLYGDPAGEAVWAEMDRLLNQEWETASGRRLRPLRIAIDSGDGYSTIPAYTWARKYPRQVMAIKGVAKFESSTPVSGPTWVDVTIRGRKLRRGAQLWTIAVSVFKSETYSWLMLDQPVDGQEHPPGYIHLPQGTSDTWIRQLVSEQLVKVKTKAGFSRLQWENPSGARNEAIDMRVYARAAAYVIGIDRWSERKWAAARGEQLPSPRLAGAAPIEQAAEAVPETQHPQPQPQGSTRQNRVNPITGRPRGAFWGKR